MSDIYFSNNPTKWRALEGLYISEIDPPGFIQGRDTSVVGIAGKCVRGPVTAQVITSVGRFLEVYGGRDITDGGAVAGEVWKALLSKPFGRVVVRRVAAAAAATATIDIDDGEGVPTDIITVAATSPGTWGNGISVAIENASDGVATSFNMRVTWRSTVVLYENLNVNSTANNLLEVIGDDLANLVVVTKLAAGRPDNGTYAPASGTEGTIAGSDYQTGMTELAFYDGVSVCLVPETIVDASGQAAFNLWLFGTLVATVSDRMFLTWDGVPANTASQTITALGTAGTGGKSDRIVWCWNDAYYVDPITGTQVESGPHVALASIFSQTDVDTHVGARETVEYTRGIAKLRNSNVTRGDGELLRAAGVTFLERNNGAFQFRNGVTTDLTTGKTEISRRRMTDFLQLSAAERLRYYVKAKGTPENRALIAAELATFSEQLREEGRIVESYEVIQDSVNTAAGRAQGVEKIFWRVRLIGHMLHLVLETEIGTGVVIESAA